MGAQRHVDTKQQPVFRDLVGVSTGGARIVKTGREGSNGWGTMRVDTHLNQRIWEPGLPPAGSGSPEVSTQGGGHCCARLVKQGTAWCLFLAALSLCSGCLPAGLCQLHHSEEPQGFFWSQLYASGQQERLQTECSMRLQPLELGEKGGSGVRITPCPKKGSCSSRSP